MSTPFGLTIDSGGDQFTVTGERSATVVEGLLRRVRL